MGLDTVELVISFEEAFGIEIPDAVAETMRTPADVIDYVHSNQTKGGIAACLQMRSFHRLRRALEEFGLVERRKLRLDMNLKKHLQGANLRQLWSRLRKEHGIRLPGLTLPNWLIAAQVAISITISFILARMFSKDAGTIALITIFLSGFLASFAYGLMEPFANRWPRWAETPRELVQYLSSNHPGDLIGANEALSREQIADAVKTITCQYCDPEEYREDARFVQDLGLD